MDFLKNWKANRNSNQQQQATTTSKMNATATDSKVKVMDGVSGKVMDADDFPFPDDALLEKRKKELQVFLRCLGQSYNFYETQVQILSNAPQEWFNTDKTASEFNLWLFTHDHKVNGKEGEWSNGYLGSRWCDRTFNGRKVRVAFYNKEEMKSYGNHYKLVVMDYFEGDC